MFEESIIFSSYFVTLPGFTLDAGLEYTRKILENTWEAELFSILENVRRCGLSGCMGSIKVVSWSDKKPIDNDSNKLQGLGMSQPSDYAGIKFDQTVYLEIILTTPYNDDIGHAHALAIDKKETDNARKLSLNFFSRPTKQKKSFFEFIE